METETVRRPRRVLTAVVCFLAAAAVTAAGATSARTLGSAAGPAGAGPVVVPPTAPPAPTTPTTTRPTTTPPLTLRPGDQGPSVAGLQAQLTDLGYWLGEAVWALNTSTGARSTPTPPGTYAVTRQHDGVRHAPLGVLYRPKYFFEGYAVHGSPSIPGWAASHGCARVSNAAMDMLWRDDVLPKGTPVWVYA